MRQLHLVRRAGDTLAREVIAQQVADGDQVRVVLMLEAAGETAPDGALALPMPPLQYDQLVEHLAWSERAVSW